MCVFIKNAWGGLFLSGGVQRASSCISCHLYSGEAAGMLDIRALDTTANQSCQYNALCPRSSYKIALDRCDRK